jgi:tetratricopeptide (TPR) repeat protein
MIEPIRNEDSSLQLTDLDRILAICDQFEADWKAGRPHRIEDDLVKVPELLRDRLFGELQALEVELKQTGNQRITPGCNAGVERVYADGESVKTPVWEAGHLMPGLAPEVPPSSTTWKHRGAEGSGVSDQEVTLSYVVVRQSGGIEPLLAPEHHRLLEKTFRPGVLIQDRYRIEREVGKGGMGQVYLARDSRLDRPVAIKVSLLLGQDRGLNQEQIDELRQSFADEARLGANLTHPAIATVYDYGFHHDKPFTVFEYLPGQTLGELLRSRGRLTLEEVRLIVGPLAQALDFAHGRYVVHRDLKPENIRATEQSWFKILDLGLAKEFRRNADWSGFAGTPAYASPEQSSGAACDGRTDQYALALIAFELLAGRRLFESRDPLVLLELHRDAPPIEIEGALPDVPGSIREALTHALSKDPNDRFASCSDFAGALGCQLLNTPAPAPEILLETDVERMTAGRLVRCVSFAEKNAVHLVLTREAIWSVYHTEVRRWSLVEIERVEPRAGLVGELEVAELAEAELVRRLYRDAEANVQAIGLLHVILLVPVVVILVVLAMPGDRNRPNLTTVALLTSLGSWLVAVNLGLRRRRTWARWAAFAGTLVVILLASGLLLLVALEVVSGTPVAPNRPPHLLRGALLSPVIALAAYVAWTLVSRKTSVVFTSPYAEVVERTPYLNPRRSWSLDRAPRRTLRLKLRVSDGRPLRVAFQFPTAGECEHWAGRLAGLAGQPGNTATPGSEAVPVKPAPVVLLRQRPTTRYQLLGPIEARADKRRRAEAGLQVRAAMIGADAVVDVQEERLPDFHRTMRRLSGTAVKAVDPESLFEFRSRWYTERIKQMGNLTVGLVVISLLVNCLGSVLLLAAEKARQGMLTNGHVPLGFWPSAMSRTALFIAVIHAVPLGMVGLVRILRWPQLVCPMAVTIGALSLRPVYSLVGILAGAIGTGIWLGMGWLLLWLDPINLAILLFGWFLARAAWRADRNFRSLVPSEERPSPASRAVAGVLAWVVAVGFALVLAGWTVLAQFQIIGQFRIPTEFSRKVTAAAEQLRTGTTLLFRSPQEAQLTLQRAVVLWEDVVHDFPSEHIYQINLGLAHLNLGTVHLIRSSIELARQDMSRARAIFEGLVTEPNLTNPQRDLVTTTLANVLISQGGIFSRKGDERAAEMAYRRAIDQLATGLRDRNTPAKVQDQLKGAALNGLAWCTARQRTPAAGDLAHARELARQAVQLTPQSAPAWNTLGVAQYRAGSYDEALASLTRSISLPEGGVSADFAFLAMTQHRLGQFNEARGSLGQLRKLVMELGAALNGDDTRFLREAEDLIEGPTSELPEDAFAR